MNRLLTGALALSLLATTSGIASAADYRTNNNQQYQSSQNNRSNNGQYNNGRYVQHNWRRGQRIQQADWRRGQRVDYRQRHLHKPARGYEWREVDGNYVEAAIVGGLIASVIIASQR